MPMVHAYQRHHMQMDAKDRFARTFKELCGHVLPIYESFVHTGKCLNKEFAMSALYSWEQFMG